MRSVLRRAGALAFSVSLLACAPNLAVPCKTSTECASGYTCDQPTGKCVAGAGELAAGPGEGSWYWYGARG